MSFFCYNYSFEDLNKKQLRSHPYIDVWPLQVKYNAEFSNTFMLVLQLACVLHMKQDWKSHTKIRIFVIVESELRVAIGLVYMTQCCCNCNELLG